MSIKRIWFGISPNLPALMKTICSPPVSRISSLPRCIVYMWPVDWLLLESRISWYCHLAVGINALSDFLIKHLNINETIWWRNNSRVAGTMVVHSSSVWVIAHSNLSQVPPLLMYLGKWPTVLLTAKRLAHVAPEVDLGECTLHLPMPKCK